jgi:hypothetical protein
VCLAVYLGASAPLPLVPWNERNPGFHVDAIPERGPEDRAVRDRLATPFVYYAGSSGHCGCGFQFRQDLEWAKERGEYEAEEGSLRAFRQYLEAALTRLAEVRFLAVSEGESGHEPVHRRRLTPDDLLREDFLFLEGELSEFMPPNARSWVASSGGGHAAQDSPDTTSNSPGESPR